MRGRRHEHKAWVWGIFLLALAVRWAFLPRTVVLQTEGTTYVTLARNLLAGRGYVGILGETELVMVSLFPHLIAALGWVVGDLVWAGRLLALVSSAALVFPVHRLGQAWFGGRAGVWAALLIALHPYLVEYAPLVRVEPLFLLAWLWGIYATWRAGEAGPHSSWIWGVPVAFGLAYLLKSEGAVYFATSLVLLGWFWWRRWPTSRVVSTLLVQAGLFALLAAPMVGWLTWQTGRLTLETKGAVNYHIAQRIAQGMDYYQAAYGLKPDGTPAGALLDRNRLVRAGEGPQRPDLTNPAYLQGMMRVLQREWYLLMWPLLGRFWLLFAVLGGIVAATRGEWRPLLFTGWYGGLAMVGVATILFVWTRYLLPLVPLAALWVAYGVDTLADILIGGFILSSRVAQRWQAVVALVLVGFLVGTHPYLRPALTRWQSAPDLEQRMAGEWLREYDPNPSKRIMSTTSQVPYYADGVHVPMAVDRPERIARYARLRGVDYVVVSTVKDANRPARAWLEPTGVPPGWEPIYITDSSTPRLVIYRLSGGN